jgi:hypothetical protein
MIVKCNRLYNRHTKEYSQALFNKVLAVGFLYSVIEIYFDESEMLYRLFPNEEYEFSYPILVRSNEFEVVSAKPPKNWTLVHKENRANLGPKKWNIFEPWQESFWQDYDNGSPKAKKCFDDEIRIIFDTDPEYIKMIDEKLGREPYFR